MTASAWLFLTVVWGLILIMTFYCFAKLLTSERRLDGDSPSADSSPTSPEPKDYEGKS